MVEIKLLTEELLIKYKTSFFETLNQLTPSSDAELKKTLDIFKTIKTHSYTFVAIKNEQIVGITKLLIEQKFSRNFAKAGHIEDVVVNSKCRGYDIGKMIISNTLNFAIKKIGCYKVNLHCKKNLVNFYKKNSFVENGVNMEFRNPL